MYDALSLILHPAQYCIVWFVIADSLVPVLDNHVHESKIQKKQHVVFSTPRGGVPTTQEWDAVASQTGTYGSKLVQLLGFSKTAAPW